MAPLLTLASIPFLPSQHSIVAQTGAGRKEISGESPEWILGFRLVLSRLLAIFTGHLMFMVFKKVR